MISFSPTTSLMIRGHFLGTFAILLSSSLVLGENNKDCSHHTVIRNIQRMCKSYAYLKRSTSTRTEYMPNEFGNDIGQWKGQGRQNGQVPSSPMSPWWYYIKSQLQQPQKPQFTLDSDEDSDATPDDLDPVYYGGEEVVTVLERWRRNRQVEEKLERFIRYECCTRGCPFPNSYLEFEKDSNICNLSYFTPCHIFPNRFCQPCEFRWLRSVIFYEEGTHLRKYEMRRNGSSKKRAKRHKRALNEGFSKEYKIWRKSAKT